MKIPETANRIEPRLVLTVTREEDERGLEELLAELQIPIFYQCRGKGTATSEMLDIFGLSGTTRLITINLVPKFLAGSLLEALERRFSRPGDAGFARGFMAATLLFCVGTMAIKGSLDGGLRGDHATLYAKSVMDAISACLFSSTLGLGVLFSAVPVLLYQGTITLLASVAGPYLGDAVIAEMNTVGSLLLLGLSLDLLGIARLKLMNYVPAMFLPIVLCRLL